MRSSCRIGLAVLLLVALPACAEGADGTDSTGRPPGAAAPGASDRPVRAAQSGPASASDRVRAERVAQKFMETVNAGDEKGLAAIFSEDARFDSAGRIYPSRDDIMNRFLGPEVLRAGGRYQAVSSRWDGDRYIVNYIFTTGSGFQEKFYYSYLIRDDLIHDVIGRYH